MQESLRLFEIEIFEIVPENKSEAKQTIARFSNELTPDDYGIQRFITNIGEVSVMHLLQNGFSSGYTDIRRTLNEVLKQRKDNNNFHGSWIGINDAVRYFADLSPQNNVWHWEYISNKQPLKLINPKVEVPENTEITFNNWLLLTDEGKYEYMHKYLDNPISGKEWITNNAFG